MKRIIGYLILGFLLMLPVQARAQHMMGNMSHEDHEMQLQGNHVDRGANVTQPRVTFSNREGRNGGFNRRFDNDRDFDHDRDRDRGNHRSFHIFYYYPYYYPYNYDYQNQSVYSLSIGDVVNMVNDGLSDDAIVAEIVKTRTIFHLSSGDTTFLRNNGVSDRVIDFMISTGVSRGISGY